MKKKDIEDDMESIGIKLNRNLAQLMENNKISLTLLHRNTGIAIPTIKRLQTDPTANPTITTLLPIANFFGLSVTQLIGVEPLPHNITGYIENKTYWTKVPLIAWDQIISWLQAKEIQIEFQVLVDIDLGPRAFALKLEEEDWPAISKGSILIIDTDSTPEHKDYALVYKEGQPEPTIKQVLIDEDKIYLKPMNPHFQLTLFDKTHRFLGVLMQIRKNTKV